MANTTNQTVTFADGWPNTGGGGGGSEPNANVATTATTAGATGVVIVRYPLHRAAYSDRVVSAS